MNIGVTREAEGLERRVALTPSVARQLVDQKHTVWVEKGAGERAMIPDEEYIRAGAQIAYTQPEVIRRSELVVQVSAPAPEQLEHFSKDTVVMAFCHLAVKARHLVDLLLDRSVTAIGYEIIEADDGRLPVLAAISEIAGQLTIPLAMHLLRSSAGGRGILLGGSPGLPPAHVVILGAGAVGASAARAAVASGARVTVLDIDTDRLRDLIFHLPHVATGLADPDSIAGAVASADVVIGAVLVAGHKSPQVVTQPMVESMRRGSVIIDAAIDQGGCVETSRPTTLAEPSFIRHGVVHYCVPNLTADISRSASMALAQAVLPFLLHIAQHGPDGAFRASPALRRGAYTHRGACVRRSLADTLGLPCEPLAEEPRP
ncbi:MAG: alanine dehydrogenase [Bryobacterales bacterium]|nr:alanine dehydrogenase [Bryobacterales bacterium]